MASGICRKLPTALIRHYSRPCKNFSWKLKGLILSPPKRNYISVQISKLSVFTTLHYNCYYGRHLCRRSLSTLPLPTSSTSPDKVKDARHKYFHKNEENKNADRYFRTTEGYRNTFFDPEALPGTKAQHPALQKFIQASSQSKSRGVTVASPLHDEVVSVLLSSLKSFSDYELLQVLHHLSHFPPCERADTPEYVRIWSALDSECLSRSSIWSLDLNFQAADVWAKLRLGRYSKFHKKLILTCLQRCGRLKKEHFMRWMFCLNHARSLPGPMAKYEIEEYLRNPAKLRSLSIHEIVLVAMACFKTEIAIKDPKLLEEMLNRIISERKMLDPISVASVAKFARYCSSPRVKPVLLRLQEAFLPELGRVGIQACTHLALIGTKSQSAYLPLVNAVIKIIEDNIGDARLKDLERIALVMTMFDADCDRLGQLILQELSSPSSSRATEIKEYGRCLPAILHYLSLRQVFSHELMNYVLGKEFRETYYANASEIYLRELSCLDFCAELELEGYSGARLGEDVRDQISQSHISRVGEFLGSKISAYDVSLRKIVDTLDPEYFVVSNILPQHHCRKIVFCTDSNLKKPIVVPSHYLNLPEHRIKYLDDKSSNIRYHVMFTCNRNDYMFSEKQLTASGRMIVRQLTKMGYEVHVVFPPFAVSQLNHILQNL